MWCLLNLRLWTKSCILHFPLATRWPRAGRTDKTADNSWHCRCSKQTSQSSQNACVKVCSQDRNSDLAELGTSMKVPGLSTQSNDKCSSTFTQDTKFKVFMPVVKAGVLLNKRSHCFNVNSWQSVLTNCTWLNCAACEKQAPWSKKNFQTTPQVVKQSSCQWSCTYFATHLFGDSAHTLLSANCHWLRFNLAPTPPGRAHKLRIQTIGCKPGFCAASLCGQ